MRLLVCVEMCVRVLLLRCLCVCVFGYGHNLRNAGRGLAVNVDGRHDVVVFVLIASYRSGCT